MVKSKALYTDDRTGFVDPALRIFVVIYINTTFGSWYTNDTVT